MRLVSALRFDPPVPGSLCSVNQHHRGVEGKCGAGHKRHETKTIDVNLRAMDGPCFRMHVYQENQPAADVSCLGRDPVSWVISHHGCLDPMETRNMLAILRRGDRRSQVVLDFGAHLGWYTLIAAVMGFEVAAWECDYETALTLWHNVGLNGVGNRVDIIHSHVDERTPVLQADREEVLFLKADVEGAEPDVSAACQKLLDARRIVHMQLEVSPVFHGGYPAMVESIIDRGYMAFNIDPGGPRPVARSDVRPFLASVQQTNMLFSRCE